MMLIAEKKTKISILQKEGIEYSKDELSEYVKANLKVGMRDMVNYIESASYGGFFGSQVPTPKKVIKTPPTRPSLLSPKIKISLEEALIANIKRMKKLNHRSPQPKGSPMVLPKIKTSPILSPKPQIQLTIPSVPTRMLNIKQVLEPFGLKPNNPKRFEILEQLTKHPNPLHANNNYREDEVADLINKLFPRGQ